MQSETLAPPERAASFSGMLQPFRHFWAVFLISLIAVVGVVVAGRLLAGSASWAAGELSVDQAISRGHLPALDAIALAIEWVLSPTLGLVIVVLVSVGVYLKTRDRMVTLTFALMVGGGWLSSELIKILAHRARPDFRMLAHPLSTEANFASFPSGHTCLATVLAVGFVLLLRGHAAQRCAVLIGTLGVLIVASSRIYVGAHYPTDVIAAIVYTTAAMLAFLAAWNRWLAAPVARTLCRMGRPTVS
jgi:membrane-associated phospholipid phosphatase